MGSVYYHGTNKENAELILKQGFREWTHFTWDLHSALVMGGMYIFGIYFPDLDITQNWQWRNPERIPPHQILYLRKFSIDCIYDNDITMGEVNRIFLQEQHGGILFCEKCNGRGGLNKAPNYGGWGNDSSILCEACGGFGCTKLNGKLMNE